MINGFRKFFFLLYIGKEANCDHGTVSGNTPLNQHGNCSCWSKLVVLAGEFFFFLLETPRRLCECLLKWPCEIIGVYEQANGAFFIVVHWHLIQATAVSLNTFVESQFGIMRPITLITFLCVVLSLQLALSHGCYSSFRCIRIWCWSVASSFGLMLPHSLGKSPYTNRPIFPSQGCWHTLKSLRF